MEKIKAINLGGWLILERWITPTLFSSVEKGDDEASFISGESDYQAIIDGHRDNWINKLDLELIKASGINVLRLSVPWWCFPKNHDFLVPYVSPLKYVDKAFKLAEEVGLKIMLDLSTVPGNHNNYNGEVIGWDKDPNNINITIEVLELLAKRYKNKSSFHSLVVLNNPHESIDINILKDFYLRAYTSLREILNEETIIVFHDSFRFSEWLSFFKENRLTNVLLDHHHYQCFDDKYNDMNEEEFLNYPLSKLEEYKTMEEVIPVLIGEWSLAHSLDIEFTKMKVFLEKFAKSQLDVFNKLTGWSFRLYKLEDEYSYWNFKNLNLRGIIKDKWIK